MGQPQLDNEWLIANLELTNRSHSIHQKSDRSSPNPVKAIAFS
jgi:hypothetical protein